MNFLSLQTRIIERLDEASTPVFWTLDEIKLAINKAQRLFAFLTLCIERTTTFAVSTDAFYSLATIADYMLPLRVFNAAGGRVYPHKVYELQLENPAWRAVTGSPTKYAQPGYSLLAITPQPAGAQNLTLTYAASPALLSLDADEPEIPEEYHPSLPKFAQVWLRYKEGGQELQKTLPLLGEFLDDAQTFAQFKRARSKAQLYDKQPFDLASFDRSRLLKMTLSDPRRKSK